MLNSRRKKIEAYFRLEYLVQRLKADKKGSVSVSWHARLVHKHEVHVACDHRKLFDVFD